MPMRTREILGVCAAADTPKSEMDLPAGFIAHKIFANFQWKIKFEQHNGIVIAQPIDRISEKGGRDYDNSELKAQIYSTHVREIFRDESINRFIRLFGEDEYAEEEHENIFHTEKRLYKEISIICIAQLKDNSPIWIYNLMNKLDPTPSIPIFPPDEKLALWISTIHFRVGPNDCPIVEVHNTQNRLNGDPQYRWSGFVHPNDMIQPVQVQVSFGVEKPPTIFLEKNCTGHGIPKPHRHLRSKPENTDAIPP